MKINRTLSHNFIRKFLSVVPFVLLFLAAAPSLSSQEQHHGVVRPLSDVKFESDDDVKCLDSTLENGDPAKGASTFILRAAPNCMVPMHYHTAEEQLIVVSGDVEAGMDGISPRVLQAGGFAMMPGKEKHWFSCKSKKGCLMFVTFDRAYDIFWVK
ncbi:MAG TPA: cupin domain-containing protein [Candidatus Acidoferrum sp.]|nr:cupin domain-containing protein [Candidatus Acidoferrum sp.]